MGENLPDKGANLARWEKQIIDKITSIKGGDLTLMQYNRDKDDNVDVRIACRHIHFNDLSTKKIIGAL